MSEGSRHQTAMEEILADAMRRWREKGDLDRLAGKPIDLGDDSPEWFANRLLKSEGFSHPAIERGRDVDQLLIDANAIGGRIRDRRRLLKMTEQDSTHAAHIDSYRRKLEEYNRAVTSFNLGVPDALHKRQVDIAALVTQVGREPATEPDGSA